jgi:hypothetical protein
VVWTNTTGEPHSKLGANHATKSRHLHGFESPSNAPCVSRWCWLSSLCGSFRVSFSCISKVVMPKNPRMKTSENAAARVPTLALDRPLEDREEPHPLLSLAQLQLTGTVKETITLFKIFSLSSPLAIFLSISLKTPHFANSSPSTSQMPEFPAVTPLLSQH